MFRTLLLALGCSLVAFFATPPSNALPFTFTFDMPAFDSSYDIVDVVGRTSVLKIEVDNGADTLRNQDYYFSDIVSLTLVSLEGTSLNNVRLPLLRAWAGLRDYAFLSTVGQGQALGQG